MDFSNLKNSLSSYNIDFLKHDIKSSFTVAAVAIPQNMAYALIAGVNPIYGIYTSIIAMISGSILGISNFMILGPTNMLAIAIASNLSFLKNGNYLEGVFFLTFMVGILQIILSLLKFGKLVNYISNSVIVGLTTGLAFLIGIGQIGSLLGLQINSGSNIINNILGIIKKIKNVNISSLLIGLTTIILILIFNRIFKKIPSFLGALILVSLGTYLLDIENILNVVKFHDSGLPKFYLFNFNTDLIGKLFTGAFSITILSFIQPVSILKTLEENRGQRVNLNREFFRLGMINIIVSFFKGFVSTGSITNTHINDQAGAESRFSQLLTGIIILIMSVLFSSIFSYIPIAALSGIVIVVAYNMVDIGEIFKIVKTTKFDAIVLTTTFLSTIFVPRIDYAIYIAVGLSIILLLRRMSNPDITHIGYNDEEKGILENKEIENKKREDYIIINFSGHIYFHSAHKLQKKLERLYCKNQKFILRLRNINHIDYTAIKEIDKFIDKVLKNGGKIIISGTKEKVYKILYKYGIVDKIGKENIFKMKDQFFSATQKAIEKIKKSENKENGNGK